MDIRRLKQVIAVSKFGSFTEAAKALSLTQSTITKSVSELENELGFSIFHRNSRCTTETDRGAIFISEARRIVSGFDDFVQRFSDDELNANKLVRLGVAPPLLSGVISKKVQSFVAQYPRVRLHVSAMDQDLAIASLKQGDIGVLICPGPYLESDRELDQHHWSDLGAALFTRPTHPLANKEHVSDEDLLRYPIISSESTNFFSDFIFNLYTASGMDPVQSIHKIDYFPMVEGIVSSSDCIGLVSLPYGNSVSFQSRFSVLRTKPIGAFPIYIVQKRGGHQSNSNKAFVRHMFHNDFPAHIATR
jgi:DNA-binding transcriptional LysR family regulator